MNELESAGKTLASLAIIWAAGWCVNRSWRPVVRGAVAVAAATMLWFLTPMGGWYAIGRCFPILIALVTVLILSRAWGQWKSLGKLEDGTAMALLLVLVAGTMLARMPLFPRIYHLGFFQAALAGMVLAAMMVAELPRWTGAAISGRRVATVGALAALVTGCCAIAARSAEIRGDQTQPVGSGRDLFYAFAPDIDAMGALVNWSAEQLRGIPPQATVMVLSEGLMINYLTRHKSPLPTWNATVTEEFYIKQLHGAPPDYVVLISRDVAEFGTKGFGNEGSPGHEIIKWVVANYWLEKRTGGDPFEPRGPKGAMVLRKK